MSLMSRRTLLENIRMVSGRNHHRKDDTRKTKIAPGSAALLQFEHIGTSS